MKTSVINLKVEPALKAKAQKRAKQLGVPLSYVLHAQLLNFTRGEKIELPYEVTTPKLDALLEEVEAEIARGEISVGFDSNDTAAMKHWLDSEDDN